MKKILLMFCLVTIAVIGEPNNPRRQTYNKHLEKYNKWIYYLIKNGVPVHNDRNDHKNTTPHKSFVKISLGRPLGATTDDDDEDTPKTLPEQTNSDEYYYDDEDTSKTVPEQTNSDEYYNDDEDTSETVAEQTIPDEYYYDDDTTTKGSTTTMSTTTARSTTTAQKTITTSKKPNIIIEIVNKVADKVKDSYKKVINNISGLWNWG